MTLVQPHWPQIDVKAKAKSAVQMPNNSTCKSYKLWYFKITFRASKEYKARYQPRQLTVSSPCSFLYSYIFKWHKIMSTVNDSVCTCSSYIRLYCCLNTVNLKWALVNTIHKCQPQGKRQ